MIENIARDIGKCSICENISPRFIVNVKIRPSIRHLENHYHYWDQDVCYLERAINLKQRVCITCESVIRYISPERSEGSGGSERSERSEGAYFSQMEFLTSIKDARKKLLPISKEK